MDELITLIEDTLNIPYIEENNAVVDGSFTVEPWMTSALVSNGKPVHMADSITIDLFYESKSDALSAVKVLWPILADNHIASTNPNYSWQEQGSIWMASMNITLMEEN